LIPPLVEMGVNAQQAADDADFGFEIEGGDIQEIEIEGDSGDLGEPMGGGSMMGGGMGMGANPEEIEGDSGDLGEPMGSGSMMGGGMGMGATPEEDDVEAETP
jgi:hypothetical protein